MAFIKAGTASQPIHLEYTDLGTGPNTVVLIHGWPASYRMWEYQLNELPRHGLRVVAYTRRGFGLSDQPWDGYDYDTFAADLKAVLEALDLQHVTLVGFSMGGGEVVRYMARYGGARVKKVALVSAVTPYLLQTADNPNGAPQSVFDGMAEKIKADRPAFLADFGKAFFGVGLISHPVSQPTLDWMQTMCLQGSPRATERCVRAFSETDFRQDLESLRGVPTLIIHGSEDATVPPAVSGDRTAQLLPDAEYLVYDGAPHGLFVIEKDRLNQDLLAFINS
ncbi:MAG: alpha/beta hydrolase [Hymenobacteraceae bacterium]|nr:alpha/beta hydrolase [Hymenobacteraceae bacterium]